MRSADWQWRQCPLVPRARLGIWICSWFWDRVGGPCGNWARITDIWSFCCCRCCCCCCCCDELFSLWSWLTRLTLTLLLLSLTPSGWGSRDLLSCIFCPWIWKLWAWIMRLLCRMFGLCWCTGGGATIGGDCSKFCTIPPPEGVLGFGTDVGNDWRGDGLLGTSTNSRRALLLFERRIATTDCLNHWALHYGIGRPLQKRSLGGGWRYLCELSLGGGGRFRWRSLCGDLCQRRSLNERSSWLSSRDQLALQQLSLQYGECEWLTRTYSGRKLLLLLDAAHSRQAAYPRQSVYLLHARTLPHAGSSSCGGGDSRSERSGVVTRTVRHGVGGGVVAVVGSVDVERGVEHGYGERLWHAVEIVRADAARQLAQVLVVQIVRHRYVQVVVSIVQVLWVQYRVWQWKTLTTGLRRIYTEAKAKAKSLEWIPSFRSYVFVLSSMKFFALAPLYFTLRCILYWTKRESKNFVGFITVQYRNGVLGLTDVP